MGTQIVGHGIRPHAGASCEELLYLKRTSCSNILVLGVLPPRQKFMVSATFKDVLDGKSELHLYGFVENFEASSSL